MSCGSSGAMMCKHALLTLGTLLLSVSAARADIININGFEFDRDQFGDPPGSAVTVTTSGDIDFAGSSFDNDFGLNGAELGELVTGDPGDRINLGTGGGVGSIVLTYDNPLVVGPGMAALFVVYEQNGDASVDIEGTQFEISFNGGAFARADTAGTTTLFNDSTVTHSQNQTVFDLVADFGFSVGDTLSTVEIRNLTEHVGIGESDPDFNFAAKAGSITAVPEPASNLLLLAGVAGLAARRHGRRMRPREG